MATWLGMAPPTAKSLSNTIVTTDLTGGGLDLTHRGYPGSTYVTNNANVSQEPFSVSAHNTPNPPTALMTSPGDQIFERIHVFPASKRYPFILSTQLVNVEVWNAFRAATKQVDTVTISGPAGVSIDTPYVLPIIFGPFVSKVYTVRISVIGAAQAANTILWDFGGVAEPLFTISGLRLLPFTISPDWEAGIDDTVGYVTDVMTAYDDTEQRVMLRAVPTRSLAYSASGLDSRESGLLASLLWSWQARSYGVLLWMDGAPLGADVVAGAVDLVVDTTQMTLAVGDTVIIIQDAFNWFASPIFELTPGSIKLDTPLDRDFFGGRTQVVPVILGRVAGSVPMDRPTNASTIVPIKFDLVTVKT
jgi:hypothetical protein